MTLKLSISGARGIVGESLTPEIIMKIATAFSDYLDDGSILIGRDSRPSGKNIEHFVGGILSMIGRDVYLAGISPTPTVAVCTKHTDAAGGIAITASHNPEQWNALKLLNKDGLFLPASFWNGLNLNDNFERQWAKYDEIGDIEEYGGCVFTHIESVLKLPCIDISAIRKSKFVVAYDGVGGAGPAVMIPLLRELGSEVIPIGNRMDGNFIHPPEPVPQNLSMLSELVKEYNADVGFATDPDADRLAVVDENGVPIGEEMTLALAAEKVLSSEPSDVVVNLSTSTVIEEIAEKHGVRVHRTPVGEYFVSKKMLEIGAKVGGEGNGGVIVPDMHPVRDAATAAALILGLMAERNEKLSRIVDEFPKKAMIKTKFPFNKDFGLLQDKVFKKFSPAETNDIDGVWFKIGGGFVHIRMSNTEPVVRLIVESDDVKKTEVVIKEVEDVVSSI